MRAPLAVAALIATTALGALPASGGDDNGARKTFRGRVVTSDVFLVAGSAAGPAGAGPANGVPSDDVLIDSLKRLERSVIGRGRDDHWRLHFAAFLSRPPEGSALRLSFYDLANERQPRLVFTSDVAVAPDQSTVVINDFVVSKSMGFESGHRYSVVAARGADRRDELARGAFALR